MTTEPTKQQRPVSIVTLLCVGALFFFIVASSGSTSTSTITSTNNEEKIIKDDSRDSEAFPRRKLGTPLPACESSCSGSSATNTEDLSHFDGQDMLNPTTMLDRLKKYRNEWKTNTMFKNYGAKNFKHMFEPNGGSVGRNKIFKDITDLTPFKEEKPKASPAGTTGWERFVFKMKMKILQIQLGIVMEREMSKDKCLAACGGGGAAAKEGSRRLKKKKEAATTTDNYTPGIDGLYSRFVWATGGHSAAAGHGNFFRESYTANMKRALKPLLKEIGLDFEARNYAMGGTDSAEEISLCMNQIFGRDVDAISWDYGMTDGKAPFKNAMYAYKAAGLANNPDGFSQPGNIPHRPAIFGIHQPPRNHIVYKTMQDLGMTTLSYDTQYMHDVVYAGVPDMFGMSDDDIANQPPYVQYFKCDGGIEVNEPGCKDNKFNNTMCDPRKARTSWHAGWKDHALVGNLMAMTILDALEDALESLIKDHVSVGEEASITDTRKRIEEQLNGMDKEERKRYNNIFEQPVPEELHEYFKQWWHAQGPFDEHLTDVDLDSFFKESSFCRTAILPSQARFKGLVTENFAKVGEIEDQNYDQGVPEPYVKGTENPNRRGGGPPGTLAENPAGKDKLLLVSGGLHQQCEDHLNLDFKDYFYSSNLNKDWQTAILPNDSEKQYYKEYDGKKARGYVLACLARCDWGRCKPGDLASTFGWFRPPPRKGEEPKSEEGIAKVKIEINGEPMTEASNMGNCYALKNKDGHVWKPNKDGRYEVKIKVDGGNEYSYIKIGSFILL